MPSSDADLVSSPLATVRRCAVGFTVCVAVVVLLGGWVAGRDELKNIVPGTVGMKALTAIGMLLSAAGITLLASARAVRLGRLCGAGTLLLGLAVGFEYAAGFSLGIDEALFRDEVGRAMGIAHPGRFAPTTALCFVALGASILLLGRSSRGARATTDLLVVPIVCVAGISVVGYLYSIPEFYGPASAAKMALVTALCFVAMAAAIVSSCPAGRLHAVATTSDPGGVLLRRLLPVAVVMPLVLGWARLKLVEAGLFADNVGAWWLSAATAVGLSVVVWRLASRLSDAATVQRDLEAQLVHLADHDAMTGLFSRRRFDEELHQLAARIARSGRPASVLVLDLDRMKTVNDALGHRSGDRMLTEVGAAIGDRVRAGDFAGRLGGDEFAILLDDTDLHGAAVLAGALREQIAAIGVRCAEGTAWTTASIGVARLDADGPASLQRADEAMYEAKRAGGDRVRSAAAAVEPVAAVVRA